MALIKCPECGTEVSDKAAICPRCSYPIAKIASRGKIRVKINPMNGRQKASILSGNSTIWEGHTGDVAEFELKQRTTVTIKYHMGINDGPAKGEGVIDPDKSSKYNVKAVAGAFKARLVLQEVDMFDSD